MATLRLATSLYPEDTYSEHEAHSLMQRCVEEAWKSYEAGEVPVGCLYVNRFTKQVVASAGNETNETKNACRHAELVAYDYVYSTLASPKRESWFRLVQDLDLWVTCEPCIMCAAALKTLGFQRCVFGCRNERFGGCGTTMPIHELKSRDYRPLEVFAGFYEKEAIGILQYFYERGNPHAPPEKRKRPLKLVSCRPERDIGKNDAGKDDAGKDDAGKDDAGKDDAGPGATPETVATLRAD
ncbi:putative tRNA-specific adenosine deaminase [Gregarina niphandrodes]|uniref:tRNA-specific adenosine deaminase n=1 Tax=Gregarina niphandrodes TaxID=110365 RepID=A0A023AZK9_GRENI|nr:putative tRNA-specific adenosine deaminase [Gregarina niphandrodes]EZG44279.1 putative tRNA-specific adenosine deaminase [Gregarina niphandrodes]|eukprot:XP_011132730.1 putative tRNA-specific adenosine deaminase [Gregarina niphandrodes]